jgi:hypothetical protein
MEQPLTIAQLDAATIAWIEREAGQTGQPVDSILRRLIMRGIAVEQEMAQPQRCHDLDALAGTWSDAEAAEFQGAVADFSRVDAIL